MKVLIAMSGGVDSSVAALMMKKAGYDCIGVTMRLYDGAGCLTDKNVRDAKAVCDSLGMPFFEVDMRDKFEEKVIKCFVSSYENGRTPNPCVECNKYLKFDSLFSVADSLGCDLVATGHYARVEFDAESGRYLLRKARDEKKDQSYFLSCLSQSRLARTVFPLGELTKDKVRELAGENRLETTEKPESQDICFVPGGDYASFIEKYEKKTFPKGDFVSKDGKKLGEHGGIIRYTVGQRKGLGIALGEPAYVLSVDPAGNTVTLGKDADLFRSEFTVGEINPVAVGSIDSPARFKVRIRYKHEEKWATVFPEEKGTVKVVFDEPQRAITPGQTAVAYDDDTVAFSGVIV